MYKNVPPKATIIASDQGINSPQGDKYKMIKRQPKNTAKHLKRYLYMAFIYLPVCMVHYPALEVRECPIDNNIVWQTIMPEWRQWQSKSDTIGVHDWTSQLLNVLILVEDNRNVNRKMAKME